MDFALMGKVFIYFAEAAWVTVEISFLSLCLGLFLGAVAALAKLSPRLFLQLPARIYISIFRGTPCLIQLFVLYFGGPQIGIQLDPFQAGAIGLGLNIGAYMAESIRGAIVAVDRGQMEAARSLGLSKTQAMVRVILPQAAGLMIRPLGINTIALIKGSSLVSTISVLELTYTAQRFIGSTYRPFEMFIMAAAFYLAIISVSSTVIRKLDRHYALLS